MFSKSFACVFISHVESVPRDYVLNVTCHRLVLMRSVLQELEPKHIARLIACFE